MPGITKKAISILLTGMLFLGMGTQNSFAAMPCTVITGRESTIAVPFQPESVVNDTEETVSLVQPAVTVTDSASDDSTPPVPKKKMTFEEFQKSLEGIYNADGKLDVGHDRVSCKVFIHKAYENDAIFSFIHKGSLGNRQFAADINMLMSDTLLKDYGFPKGIEDDALYEFAELWSSAEGLRDEKKTDRILMTGRALRTLGLAPRYAIQPHTAIAYHLKKVRAILPQAGTILFEKALEDSLERYRKYGKEVRFHNSFIAQTLVDIVEQKDTQAFINFFTSLAMSVHNNPHIYVGDLSRFFADFIDERPDLRDRLFDFFIEAAFVEQGIEPFVSELAVKMIRVADIGEILITSPEAKEASGTGGIRTAISELAHELARQGVCVTVTVPLFVPDKKRIFEDFTVRDTGHVETVRFANKGSGQLEDAVIKLYEAYVPVEVEGVMGASEPGTAVRMVYQENDTYYNALGKGIDEAYGNGKKQRRFMRMLSQGTLLAARSLNIYPSIIQTTDWSTATLKAYLEGRERLDDRLKGDVLKKDAHFKNTKVFSVAHQLHKDYQGCMFPNTDEERNDWLYYDLGFSFDMDKDIFLDTQKGSSEAWHTINPAITALITSDAWGTVGADYLKRILSYSHDEEFRYLGKLVWDFYNEGKIDTESNGISQVELQKRFFPMIEKSFLEMGHEGARRKLFDYLYQEIMPKYKKRLQHLYGLPENKDAFLATMMHRTGSQKGHQLMLEQVWDAESTEILKTYGGYFERKEEITKTLTDTERKKLQDYAWNHGRRYLRALEVVCILHPKSQFVIAGSAESFYYADGFSQIADNFPQQVRFVNEFVKPEGKPVVDTANRFDIIMTGGDMFMMPSANEPDGISDKEDRTAGVACLVHLIDGLIKRAITVRRADGSMFNEGFKDFNPVEWINKYEEFDDLYRNEPQTYKELRYQDIVQDNRWVQHAKNYIERDRTIRGRKSIPYLQELEIAAAIHRARLRGDPDPADELMKAGYTIEDAVTYVMSGRSMSYHNKRLTTLIKENFDSLIKLPETADIMGKVYTPAKKRHSKRAIRTVLKAA